MVNSQKFPSINFQKLIILFNCWFQWKTFHRKTRWIAIFCTTWICEIWRAQVFCTKHTSDILCMQKWL